jgi:nitrite reductase (NADH) small subunit
MTLTEVEVVVGQASDIPPGEGRNFEFAGHRIAVFHTRSGHFYAVQAWCPHKQGPLADGLVGGTTVICPLHSWKFDLVTGEPMPRESAPSDCKLKTYSVRVDDAERILLRLPRPATAEVVI